MKTPGFISGNSSGSTKEKDPNVFVEHNMEKS